MNWWPFLALLLGSLLGVVGYFLKRYVDQTDKRIDEAFKLNSQTLEKVDGVADQLKVANTSFQSLLSSEKKVLADGQSFIHGEAKAVRELVTETKKGMTEIETQVKEIKPIVQNLVKLSLKNDAEIKTLIQRIGPDTVIVKQKP